MAKRKKTKRSKSKGPVKGFFGGIFKFLWKALPFVAVLAVLGGAGYGVTTLVISEPSLKVDTIRIIPEDSLIPQDIARLERRLMGKRLLDLDLRIVAAELEKDIRIDQAVVKREFPSTVVIDIRRRVPFAALHYRPDEAAVLVSLDGMILDTVTELDDSWTQVWETGASSRRKHPGNRIRNSSFYKLPPLVESFSSHKLSDSFKIAGFAIDQEGNISMRFQEGLLIKVTQQDSPGRDFWQKLALVLDNEDVEKISYIDLRYDRVVVKRKEGV